MEEWKPVDEYAIEVSNRGRVRSTKTCEVLRTSCPPGAYERLVLTRRGKCKSFLVHTLVATAFVAKVQTGERLVVNHKDGNRSNNIATNLEWVTTAENNAHSRKLGRGLKHGFPVQQLDRTTGRVIATFKNQTAADVATKIAAQTIGRACLGKCQCQLAGGYKWRFAPDPRRVKKSKRWRQHPSLRSFWISRSGRVAKEHGVGYLRVLKSQISPNGYLQVASLYIHRLVAETWIPQTADEQKSNPIVDHRNGKRQDNRLANLEWVSHVQNVERATGVPVDQIDPKTGKLLKRWPSISAAAHFYGKSSQSLNAGLANGWLFAGYRWVRVA